MEVTLRGQWAHPKGPGEKASLSQRGGSGVGCWQDSMDRGTCPLGLGTRGLANKDNLCSWGSPRIPTDVTCWPLAMAKQLVFMGASLCARPCAEHAPWASPSSSSQ